MSSGVEGFEARFLAEKLTVLNPHGDVGFACLWTPVPVALSRLQSWLPEAVDPSSGRIAVIANLYGDGLFEMLGNLLYNPQLRYLVAMGQPMEQPTVFEIEQLLEHGVEHVDLLGQVFSRIVGTSRLLPTEDLPVEALQDSVSFSHLGLFGDDDAPMRLNSWYSGLPARLAVAPGKRIEVTVRPAQSFTHRPSQVEAFQVVRPAPLAAWKELVARTMRFGVPVSLAKGKRLELLDVKVVITAPVEDLASDLKEVGFDLLAFKAYQRDILSPTRPEDVTYTYGHRMGGYFAEPGGPDCLGTVIGLLRADPQSRRAYVSIWDTAEDLAIRTTEAAVPCLTTLYFRRSEGRLHLAVTFRTHNLLTAWLQNVYGLMAIQAHVAEALDTPAGSITIVSHCIGIDPSSSRMPIAERVAGGWRRDDDVDPESRKHQLREDPNGYFTVTTDKGGQQIVASLRHAGVVIDTYEGRTAAQVSRRIAADGAVSLVSHALWLGQELARAEVSRPSRSRRVQPRLAVFDIGATLMDGPDLGPANQLVERLNLPSDGLSDLATALMTSPLNSPEDLARLVLGAAGGQSQADVLATATAVWDEQRLAPSWVEGARAAVEAMREAGMTIAIASNIWRPYLDGVLGLWDQAFSDLIPESLRFYSFEQGVKKPAPDLLERVLRAAGHPPSEAVMIGDSYGKDVAPALELGMQTAWVLHRPIREAQNMAKVLSGQAPPPTHTLANISELAAAVVGG